MHKDNIFDCVDQLSDLGRTVIALLTRAQCDDQIEPAEGSLEEGPLHWSRVEMRDLTRIVTQSVLEAQAAEQVQADYYERTEQRQGYRNGHRTHKKLATPFGFVEDVPVPRLRHQSLAVDWLDDTLQDLPLIRELSSYLFTNGLGVRAIAQASEALFGASVSPSTVSRFNEQLQHRYEDWLEESIDEDIRYLYLDGLELKVARGSCRCSETALVAMGLTQSGERRIIGFVWAASENKAACRDLLELLERRGLDWESLEMVTIDGGKGFASALEAKDFDVPIQRCWAHKARNILGHTSAANAEAVADDLGRLQEAATSTQAQRLRQQFIETWEESEPQAVRSLKEAGEQLHSYLEVPSHHWHLVKTTNLLERAFQEFQRKFKQIPMMPTPESAERLVFAQCQMRNRKWRGRQIDGWERDY